MGNTYNEELKKVMASIANNAPHSQLTLEINNLKTEILRSIKESQRIVNLLDALSEQFNILPVVPTAEKRKSLTSTLPLNNEIKKAIFDLAIRSVREGIIDTKALIPEARRLGDTRSDKGILIGLGNMLYKEGWRKIANCKYAKPELMEMR